MIVVGVYHRACALYVFQTLSITHCLPEAVLCEAKVLDTGQPTNVDPSPAAHAVISCKMRLDWQGSVWFVRWSRSPALFWRMFGVVSRPA